MLARRFLLSWWRSPINLAVQVLQYIFFALMIGEPSLASSDCSAHTHSRGDFACASMLPAAAHVLTLSTI